MRRSTKNKVLDLRKRAEAALARQQERLQELSVLDLRQLIHELGTHQLELEMQNEELRRTRTELETTRARYADLFNFSPVGYFLIDAQGLIREVNLAGAKMLGSTKSMLQARPFAVFIERADRSVYEAHRKETVASQARQVCELRIRPRNAPLFYAQLQSTIMDNIDGETGQVRTVLIDISGRKQAEEERERVIAELRIALEKVKTLSGLLPICSTCKKIRNDEGYWEQVDSYITLHTHVLFSHGLCPDCYAKALQDFEQATCDKKPGGE